MNRKSLVAIIFILIGICSTAFAQGNTVTFNNKPINWSFNQDNFLVIQLANSPKPLIFGYMGKPFPGGTQTRSKTTPIGNDKAYAFEIMMPGDNWRPLTWDMLYCKDKDGKTCEPVVTPTPVTPLPSLLVIQPDPPKQPDPPPKEEKFKCEDYGLIGFGVTFVPLLFAPPIEIDSSTSNVDSKIEIPPVATAAAAGAVGAGIDCGVQYLIWRHNHPK